MYIYIVYNAPNAHTIRTHMHFMVKLSATLTAFQCHVEHISGVLYGYIILYADVQQR